MSFLWPWMHNWLTFIAKTISRIRSFTIFASVAILFSYLITIRYNRNTKPDYDVIIIGAGFSGVGAASSLYKEGIKDFLILEAKCYIGGRVHRKQFDGVNVPLGAGWIHKVNENHFVWKLAQQYKLKYYSDDYDDVTYRSNIPF